MLQRFALYLLIILTVSNLTKVIAQGDDLPSCAGVSLSGDLQTELRNRNERIDDFVKIAESINTVGLTEETILDMMYWAAMADSADFRSEAGEYPSCAKYKQLNQTYESIVQIVYAVAVQANLLANYDLNDFQRENLSTLGEHNLKSLSDDLVLWITLYNDLK